MDKLQQYADTISEFVKNKQIQVLSVDNTWETWGFNTPPAYTDWRGFRVKPERNKYRVGLLRNKRSDSLYTYTVDGPKHCIFLESKPHFIKWLTDWVEYDCE